MILAVIDPFIGSLIVGLLLAATSIVLSELLRPKPEVENARPGKEFEFPTAQEGRVIPVVFGTEIQEAMNVVWWGDRRQKKIKETLKTGLFSSETVVRGFKYFVGWQGALSVGQLDAVLRVWIGDVEVFDGFVQDGVIEINEPKLFGGNKQGLGGVIGDLRIFSGAQGQTKSTYLQDFIDPLPNYTKTAYALWEGGYIGNSTQIKPWKFEVQRLPNQLGLTGNLQVRNASVASSGTGYALGQQLTLAGGNPVVPASFVVETIGATSANVIYGGRPPTTTAFGTSPIYTVGDILTVKGGTFVTPAQFQVTGVTDGQITTVALFSAGEYSVTSDGEVGVSGGTGNKATLEVTYGSVKSVSVDERGNYSSIPSNPASFAIGGSGSGATLNVFYLGSHAVNGVDSNPACAAFELLTDTDWGFGISSSKIDAASFLEAGETLFEEGNGFSFLLDRPIDASELKREIERQIDGTIYLDQRTGLFKMALFRAGYDIDDVPQIVDNVNLKNITDFTRGTWDGTTNQVQIEFEDRQREYAQTFAIAQDLANSRIQGSQIISAQMTYPGVKDKDLANQIASRELRALSTPLAKATVTVDRSLSAVVPGDVVAVSDSTLGVIQFPMRVLSVNYGTLDEGTISLGLVQDVFQFAQPFFGAPDDTRWTFPQQDVVAPPEDEIKVFEAPYALAIRDTDLPGQLDRIWATARNQNGVATSQFIHQRNDPTTPVGAYEEVGEIFGFSLIGELAGSLSHSGANPSTVIQLDPSPDTVDDMLEELVSVSPSDVGGQNLRNLLLIDDEFLGATVVSDADTHIDLNGVYRGMLDSAPADHAAGAKVWLLTAGGGLSSSGIPQPNVVDVQVRPSSPMDDATELESATIQFQMNNRARRPYPPVELSLNGDRYPAQVDIDDTKTGGTTLDDKGLEAAFTRRDFRTPDEVLGITTDAETLDPTFPAANSTTYKMRVIEDPLGAATVLFETDLNSGEALVFASRTKILRETGGVIPSTLAVEVVSSHTFNGVVYESTQSLDHTFNSISGTLDDDTELGVLALNVVSSVYTAPATGTININIGTALATGDVEYRVNGGAFAVGIAATNTSGTITGVTSGDEIEIRHTQSGDNSSETFVNLDTPGNNNDAFGVLTY